MQKNKKLLVAAAVGMTALLGLGLVGVTQVEAATNGGVSTLIQNLANKFNVSTTDVQAVFDQTRVDEEKSRLDEAVAAGTITSEQETLIIAKQAEIKTKMDEINNKQLTQSERQTALQSLMKEVQQWQSDNEIPQGVMNLGRGGMRGGMRDGMGEGMGMGFDR